MRLVFLTSKTYPATTANHISTRELSKAFSQILDKNFTLTIAGKKVDELETVQTKSFFHPFSRFKMVSYILQLPLFILKNKFYKKDVWFYSNDHYLSLILIFLKRIIFWEYKLCSDWHLAPKTWLARFVARSSDALVSTTDHLSQTIISEYEVEPEKCLTAYGGFEEEKFKSVIEPREVIRQKLNLPPNSFLVGYVGFFKTMGMNKGLDLMVEALSLIHDDSIKVVLVGGKKQEIEEYKVVADKFGVLDRVTLIPVVDSFLVPLYEKAMDVLVIPYPDEPHFRDHGFPLKVYEYMASNRPILYSRLDLIAEMLGDCACSFDPSSPTALAISIEYVKSNPEKAKKMALKARSKVGEYSWNSKAKKIISFLDGSFGK